MNKLIPIRINTNLKNLWLDIQEFNFQMTHFVNPPSSSELTENSMDILKKISNLNSVINCLPPNERKEFAKKIEELRTEFETKLKFFKNIYC